jgi:hypothetical protein
MTKEEKFDWLDSLLVWDDDSKTEKAAKWSKALHWADYVDESERELSTDSLAHRSKEALELIADTWGDEVGDYVADCGEYPPGFDPESY